ncbi:MAG: tetratricopeptide repeat protein [Lachnospiraceae bacterium]|nr:tetratricopeptide repeat protein [Lachnospiraceae bacterium]
MKKKIFAAVAAAALFTVSLTGCTDKSKKQDEFKAAGIEYMKAGNYAEAKTQFERALDNAGYVIGDRERDINYYLASADYMLADLDGALERINALLEFNDKDQDAMFFKGCILLAKGQNEDAVSCYNAAMEIDPGNYDMGIMAYENLMSYGLTEEASALLNKAVSYTGEGSVKSTGKGRMLLILDRYEEAINAFEEAALLGNNEALLYEAKAMAEHGDTEGAAAKREKYLSQVKEPSIEGLSLLAEIARISGDYQGALSYVDQALLPLSEESEENTKKLMQNQSAVKSLKRTEIACLEFTGDFNKAYEKAAAYMTAYPADVAAARELVFLDSRRDQ